MDIGYLRMMPNMVLTAPADETEVKLALEFALSEGKPVVIRYPKDFVPTEELVKASCAKPFKLGKSVVVKKSKESSIAIVSYGSILAEALRAAEMLASDGIPVDVINARFAAPIDEKIIQLLEKGKGIITVEDHTSACGFGSAVLELAAAKIADNKKPTAIRVLGAPRQFIKHDTRPVQLMQVGINADTIAQTARDMLQTERLLQKA